jgi:hypothetical protein
MNDYKFLSFKPIKDDPYLLGVATVQIANRFVVRFGLKPTKDGGQFYAIANYGFKDETGEKKYMPAFVCDSRGEDDVLFDFVRENVKLWLSSRSANSQVKSEKPRSMDEVTANEQVPF